MAPGILRLFGRISIARRRHESAIVLIRYASTGKSQNVDEKSAKEAVDDVPKPETTSVAAKPDYEEVAYAPRRVMPLPEDRPEEVEVPTSAPKKVLVRKAFRPASFEYNLPLPRMVPQVQRRTLPPMSLLEAIRIVKKGAWAGFDETVEAHIRLNIDPKRTDQSVRGAVTLPHGSGKTVKVCVFAEGAAAEDALAAGADVVGCDDLIASILKTGKLDFQKCIASPSVMPKLGKIARILGPRGLMPNPKVGSVTSKLKEAVKAAKQGRVDFKTDKEGIIHAGLGKVSFTEEALFENISVFMGAIAEAKPAGLKKASRFMGYFNKVHLTSTMGKSILVSVQSIAAAADEFTKAHDA